MSAKDLEEFWSALNLGEIPEPIKPHSSFEERLEKVKDLVQNELKERYKKQPWLPQHSWTPEFLSSFIAEGVETFIRTWHEHLRSQDMTGLLSIVLEAQQLDAMEMKGFVKALPQSVLERALRGSVGSQVNGTFALLALEKLRREGRIVTDYVMERRDARIFVTVYPKNVAFALDESFPV